MEARLEVVRLLCRGRTLDDFAAIFLHDGKAALHDRLKASILQPLLETFEALGFLIAAGLESLLKAAGGILQCLLGGADLRARMLLGQSLS